MPTAAQLKKAIQIAEQIQSLQADLESLLGTKSSAGAKAAPVAVGAKRGPKKRRKRSKMSPEGRARIAAAQRARWAKVRGK